MSHRGEDRWKQCQYALGVEDGLNGRQGKCADQHYQLGYCRGRSQTRWQKRRVKTTHNDA